MLRAAFMIGILVVALGIFGLVLPDYFVRLVHLFQAPPIIYVAAIVRITFGIVLVLAAPASRATIALRILGIVIVVGGALTPFISVRLADLILGWWSWGPGIVRAWAAAALLLGVFIIYATGHKRRAA